MDNKINSIVNDLKSKGYFKYGNNEVKRYSKLYHGFEPIAAHPFINILNKEYKVTGENLNKYRSLIISRLPMFPNKEYNNYQEYMGAKKEPSFKQVLNRFLDNQYKTNNLKKTNQINNLNNKKITDINLNDIIPLLINNDVFFDRGYSELELFKYDADNEKFIPVTKDNFTDYININRKDISDRLFKQVINHAFSNLTYLNGLVNGFKKGRKRDLTLKQYKSDYEYITNLIESFNLE